MKSKEELLREEYLSRINSVMDFIEKNLSEELTLDMLADVAKFSKFHFHRIFYSITGERLFEFIYRLRIERSAVLLVMNPKLSLTEIAYSCGIPDSSMFSRKFKQYFGISPLKWRSAKIEKSNHSQTNSNSNIETFSEKPHIDFRKKRNGILPVKIEVKKQNEFTIVYLRYTGAYKGNQKLFEGLFSKLMKWAGPRGLISEKLKSVCIYHDSPEITAEEKLRVTMGLVVPENTKAGSGFGKMNIPGGYYAIGLFSLDASQYGDAWEYVCADWLPSSGYQMDDGHTFELYEEMSCGDTVKVKICIPVKPL